MQFSVGDYCIINNRANETGERVLEIPAFIVFGPVGGKYYVAVDGFF